MAYIAVVSGGSGYIGTELVKQLLVKGYTVRATVRSTSKTEKVAHLLALGEALPGKLELHEADLLKEGSFDAAVKGAHVVFHTASPFFTKNVEDGQKQLVDPAVNGTKNVLGAVVKSLDTVKRVVLTSSFAAIIDSKRGPLNGSVWTEEDWNNGSTVEADPYLVSKTAAERTGWELAKQHGFHLCVINPTFVLGPVTSSRTDGTSIDTFKAFMENHDVDILPYITDVRDIVRAHVLAAEVPTAQGRYIVSNASSIPSKVISDALKEAFPEYQFPAGKNEPSKVVLDNSKVQKELGLQLHPPQETFVDMARTLIALGVAKPVKK